jgi:DNA ligase 1
MKKGSKGAKSLVKGQTTLNFSGGKMQLVEPKGYSQSAVGESRCKEVDEENQCQNKKDPVDKGSKCEVTLSRKRKPNQIGDSDEEEVIATSKPSTTKKAITNPSKDQIKKKELEDEIAKMEANLEYLPLEKWVHFGKDRFHPIEDSPMDVHQHIPFSILAKAWALWEETKGVGSQDMMKTIISNIFRIAICHKPKELFMMFQILVCKLGPKYETKETGVGDSIILDAIAKSSGKSLKHVKQMQKKFGDLGSLAFECKSSHTKLDYFLKTKDTKQKDITVKRVFETIQAISNVSGKNAKEIRVNHMMKLMMDFRPFEVKYFVRFFGGNMNTGAAEKTYLASLARAFAYTPGNLENYPPSTINYSCETTPANFKQTMVSLEETINEAVCTFPNTIKIVETLLKLGPDHHKKLLDHCYMRVGVPVKPMLAKAANGLPMIFKKFENIAFAWEYKYDGFRGQFHFQRNDPDNPGHFKINVFSRNLDNMSETYPDAIKYLSEEINEEITDFIMDCEVVAYDRVKNKILPFQKVTTRSRKDVEIENIEVTICLFAFDLLYLNGEPLIKKTFKERRAILHETFTEDQGKLMFAKSKDAESFEEIEGFLKDSIDDSWEGLMIKTLEQNATYQPNRRTFNWIKLKKDYLDTQIGDSIDLVVVGADYGKGKRTGKYGSFLFAVFDEDTEVFQTIVKAGSGFNDEDLDHMFTILKDLEIEKSDPRVRYRDVKVDVWFQLKIVLEIKWADLSISPTYTAAFDQVEKGKGISLRFPRYIRTREDKNPEDCTTSSQIEEMYRNQPSVSNNLMDDDD